MLLRQKYSPRVARLSRLLFVLILPLLLVACSEDDIPEVGPRPASELSTVVEAYLQSYQPGPLPRLFQTTYLYDRNGELLAELFSEGRRTWVPLSQISPYLINATIATEDSTFFINTGIDPIRIAGAAMQNMEQGEIVSGASTITMQLARNLFLGADDRYDQSLDRKAVEAAIARELTDTYTKEEILEMYLNMLNYGHLAYGPEAASRIYFGKSAADLTRAEAALLAGIPQRPAYFDPFVNFEAVRQRQQTVLDLMVRHGYLTPEEADQIYQEPLQLNPSPEAPPIRAPHFVNYLVSELDARLGTGFVRRGGLHIFTTLDLQLQEIAQATVSNKVAELSTAFDMNNAALVAMKPGTAEILAMVGSADYTNDAIDGQVNVATRLRQPGSSIKPILYGIAIEDNLISPATVLWDTPVRYKIEGQPDYEPKNYDRTFHGPVTARTALANSYNIPAVKLLDQVGVARMLEGAQAMGIRSLFRGPEWYGLSLTLGGGEVTLLDMATAYHTLSNQGMYVPPRPILAIHDASGTSLVDALNYGFGRQVVSESTAALVTDMLSDTKAREPAFGVNNRLRLSRPAAAKTGTTDDNRDNWTVGYTRYLLTGVWVGNTQGKPMSSSAVGSNTAAVLWNEFMERVIGDAELRARIGAPDDEATWQFELSSDIALLDACPPGMTCREGGGELFSKRWLDVAYVSGGPLSDSVVTAPSLSVFRGNQLLGYCLEDGGVVRTLVRLPARLGPPGTIQLAQQETPDAALGEKQASIDASVAAVDAANPVDSTDGLIDLAINSRQLTQEMLQDRRTALSYTARVGGQVSLGPCDEVQTLLGAVSIARNELGRSNATVKVQPFAPPTATPTTTPTDVPTATSEDEAPATTPTPTTIGTTPTPTNTPATETPTPVPSATPTSEAAPTQPPPQNRGLYQLANIYHDNNCPGRYVMGRVINWNGGPVAGVNIRLEDGWGNVYFATSKGNANDYGLFDFPLYSDSPQDLRVTVLDAGGNPISPTIIIPHKKSAETDFACHHVMIQGG